MGEVSGCVGRQGLRAESRVAFYEPVECFNVWGRILRLRWVEVVCERCKSGDCREGSGGKAYL